MNLITLLAMKEEYEQFKIPGNTAKNNKVIKF
jgi:hypothetical protein